MDSEAFVRAYRHAVSRVTDGVGRTVIDVPPGVYRITEPGALQPFQGAQVVGFDMARQRRAMPSFVVEDDLHRSRIRAVNQMLIVRWYDAIFAGH